jgi:GMP synthase-like glutamine amidotransferase
MVKCSLFMIKVNAEPKPILAVYNRLNPEGEHASLVKAASRARIQRPIVPAFTLLDNNRSWKEKTEDLSGYAAVWSGGSGDVDLVYPSPYRDQFLKRMSPLVSRVRRQGISFVGECVTHQGVAHDRNGVVGRREGRNEGGTILLNLTPAGREHPLFNGFPKGPISMIGAHKDNVLVRPPEARILGWTDRDPYSVLEYPMLTNEGSTADGSAPYFVTLQLHGLLKPGPTEALMDATNARITVELGLEPFEKTHPFGPIDDNELLIVNLLDGLPSK